MRVLAVDWSGRLERAAEFLWLADVQEGSLCELRNGLTREELIAEVVGLGEADPSMTVGLDFAFSFPRWWCEERGWTSGRQVWAAMTDQGESLLAACDAPLWGRPRRPNPLPADRLYRRTDWETGAGTAKSVFQVGGAGAVGTGSIRGMPHLLALAKQGFSIWPFEGDGGPRVVEIYPRALTGPVRKNSWQARHGYLFERFPDQSAELLERAAGSEDAFDAAVSALAMGAHREELASLTPLSDPDYSVEGRIWSPE